LGQSPSTMKDRGIRRVFDTNSKATMADTPEAAEASSTSSGITSQHSDSDSSDDQFLSDPYADIRDHLEALAARDKATYAHHKHSEDIECIGEPTIPSFAAVTTYLGYAVLILCGHIRDIFARLFQRGRYLRQTSHFPSDDVSSFAPLLKSWENFYTRRLYHRIQDCFNRPIASNPGARIQVLERVSRNGNKTMDILGPLNNLENDQQKIEYTSGSHFVALDNGLVARSCLNLGSYNYLGFADDWDVTCRKGVMEALDALPVSTSSSRMEFGTTRLHRQVEQLVSSFLGKEDAMCLNMGFNTNATTIPALVNQGDLIISDALNHTSIVNGARGSGAAIRTFRHNDTVQLEEILREAIIMGRPRTRRPWNKILVIVEGIYSMEGEYCDLRNVARVSKKYGAYIYLDEAHSIGAMGSTGRGCVEYTGVDTSDIDIMMGTFTKSFGGMGGYIAGSKEMISFLRQKCAASACHNSLSPVVCQQIISSFKVRTTTMTNASLKYENIHNVV
jgi:serine palmitoyltransferase